MLLKVKYVNKVEIRPARLATQKEITSEIYTM